MRFIPETKEIPRIPTAINGDSRLKEKNKINKNKRKETRQACLWIASLGIKPEASLALRRAWSCFHYTKKPFWLC